MATSTTRRLRKTVHDKFDPIWKGSHRCLSRGRAYEWLAGKMGLSKSDCHISRFDADLCRKALAVIDESRDELVDIRKGHKHDKRW